jgi:hypothetical protein
MKAVLALIAIYVAAFIIATQGASQNPVQASTPADISAASRSTDPAKEADLRSLLEFVGAKQQLQAAASESATQYGEKLRASTSSVSGGTLNDAKRPEALSSASETFQRNFDQQRTLKQITGIYDKHFTDDEVKGLLDFFSSPLGQKFAAETPKIAKEVAAVETLAAANATRDSLHELSAGNSADDTSILPASKSKSQAPATVRNHVTQISQRP